MINRHNSQNPVPDLPSPVESKTSRTSFEIEVARLWQEVLGFHVTGHDENFFEMGGTSLLATKLLTRLNQAFERNLQVASVFEYPTVRSMAGLLAGNAVEEPVTAPAAAAPAREPRRSTSADIAIIGMTGRFPGADTVEQFWNNLCSGVESVTFFDQKDLEGRDRSAQLPDNYVAARPILENPDLFDAEFFGIYPKEAEQMDPQHRVFLECAWELLERAGYDPTHTKGMTGVFAGCSMNTYFMHNLANGRRFLEDFTGSYQVGSYVTMLGNDKDFLPTRISYKLNLNGPSVAVQTACSTSLVAVSQACQSLMTGGCDMALAGAVSITFPQRRGYVPQEGGIVSEDGHCRPFDHRATGTVFGSGAAVLLLKRLDDAIADGDQLLGVIRGFAVNNDGANKVGYTAPGVEGQSQVIARAQKMAGISADSISYIEAHGTATPLGDPIEIAALSKAFSQTTGEKQFCAIGTAKAGIGHLDVASGAAGLIKTVLQLEHQSIPKLLHFEKPNPHLGLSDTPFFVPTETLPWPRHGRTSEKGPRRAGVSAFGIGGTNAHVIVEEAPETAPSDEGRQHQLLVWSAKNSAALTELTSSLARHLASGPRQSLADIAFTLQAGRSAHQHRRALVASSVEEAASLLGRPDGVLSEDRPLAHPGVVFCFPGQGIQTPQMARELYETEPVFRAALDACSEKLRPFLGESLIDLIYPAVTSPEAAARLSETQYAQPAIFAVEYALAQLWISWGIRPDAMVGHSIGEYVAVCLAGALSLDDALRLVAERGRLMQQMPRGSMLAVRTGEERLLDLLSASPDLQLDLAAVNGPQLCVVSGPDAAIDAFVETLDNERIAHRRLITSHAFHSRLVEDALPPFAEAVRTVSFGRLGIPCASTLTGSWLTDHEIADPGYWTRQLRHTVRFADAIHTLAKTPDRVFLEVGPSETLTQLMRQTLGATASDPAAHRYIVMASLAGTRDGAPANKAILTALGRLWNAGIFPDWTSFHAGFERKRVLLPTYPFQRRSYWIAPPQEGPLAADATFVRTASLPVEHTFAEDSIMASPVAGPAPADKIATLNEIRSLITDLSGMELGDADPDSSFLELGFDSLFLTQLTQAIQSRYRVKLTFRQIMESYPTIASLAAHMEETAAPELLSASVAAAPAPQSSTASSAAAAVVPASVAVPATVPVIAPGSSAASLPAGSFEALFAAQTQALASLFQQQLAILGAGAPALPAPVQPVAAQPVAAPVAQPQTIAESAAAAPSKPVFTPFKPLQRGEDNRLNETQQQYLNTFIADYNRRTLTSKQFTQQHRSVFADGRVVSGFHAQIKELIYPLVVDRAKGAYLWDKDGNRYIDILNGYGAILYGHSPDFIVDAVHRQLELGFAIGPQTELVGECSELIRELTGMERVTFCNTGSEAVMGAMRLARTVTGRNLIVMFSGDYHGSFDEVLVKAVGGHRTMPAAPGIPRESVANVLVLDYGTPESLEIIRQRAGDIAAVLVEPVQSRHPELRPAEFLHEVRRITEQNGAALIFDEVVTGFRTHPGGMQAVYGIRADLATYGKVVAGGLPVGILAGRPAFMDALDGGSWQYGDESFPEAGVTFYAGTFMRHPLAMAAVRASLRHIKEEGLALQNGLSARTAALATDLQKMFAEFSHPSSLETYASWFYFPAAHEPFLSRLLHFHLRHRGIHIQEGFPCFLTTAHTPADLDFVREAFRDSLSQMHAMQASAHAEPPTIDAPAPESTAPVAESVREFAITEPQREILLSAEMGEDANCAFNESTSLTLKGALNETALLEALQQLVDRHQALRLTFNRVTETAIIAPPSEPSLQREDLSDHSEAAKADRLKALIEEEGSTPFDLAQGPLFRLRLVRLSSSGHVLFFTAHHIIFDGWSTNVFFSELSELYNAADSGRKASLAAPLTFSAYAARQSEQTGTMEYKSVEEYWIEKFRTPPSPLQIPTDRPRAAVRSHEGATKRFVFDSELFRAVRKTGARQGSTLFATLLGATAFLLHRLCDQDDVVIGIPMAGQSRVENGSTLVGHCVNFLPIRSGLESEQQSLAEFLKQTRRTLLDAYDHQDYTYGTLLHKLRLARDPSRLQLIEIQANVEQVGADLQFRNLTADLRANGKTHVNMDLFFNFVDRGSELWLDCDYNTNLFDATTIDRWFGHIEAILRAFVQNADEPCSQVSLLTAAQEKQLLTGWNQTAASYPSDSSIHRVFEDQVRRTPSSIALVAKDQTLTYAQLNEKANQLARYLFHCGVTPGSRVALCLHRSLESIASLLAILKAGASYVPVDPAYPAPRLQYLVKDSGAKVLLTQQSIVAGLPALDVNIVCLDHDWPAIAVGETGNLSQDVRTDDLAYVMYTSGSTGNPKGVLVPQKAVLRLVKNNPFASFSADEVFLQLAPMSFDASTFEVWGALLNGGRLVLGPAERVAPEEIGRLIADHNVTTLWLTAALFHLMVTEHLEALRPLRQLLAGGDILSLTHVRRVCEELPHLRLVNGYGPTENTTFTCCHPITLDSLGAGTVPIGRPIANTRIYILNAQRKPVPIGVSGELYAAGDGLALGYLNAPELTEQKFVAHTFGNGVTERLYRTGDLARYRADGIVEFLGRIDTQVKIRGYRIELAEIEYALEQSPKVKSAVVAVRTDWVTPGDTPGDKRLVAYVVPAQPGDSAALVQDLRQLLQEQLPDYMRPAAIMVLDSLPHTINGKVDRRALPAPVPEQMLRKRSVVYPRTPNEELLAGIWSKVLGVKDLGVEDSIFELGGDSLLIFRITTLAQQAGLGINARHIFRLRTIAAICAELDQAGQEAASPVKINPIQAIPRSQYRQKLKTTQAGS
ncbi:non-ribosomal peptide synthetase/type I polyketide synthase [Paracidobacterium acidisoli]|uniref:Amino acid adenylation domain-containing protein n=1 Tax=Paracidobacterium acidisoli TaxID=2303751 RepID=A0A372IR16_9BACT|nr:non-ribosomal peptide synthetase/type I polyketide synthase [Paracidobacterium acidisoli]MBT9330253.1 amino acid adenylation domain-containing protein [Paracidobacterium acidisoli]